VVVYVFIGLQACFAGWLGPKETKTQGLHRFLSDHVVFIGIKDCCAIPCKKLRKS
jgi:hypothetical protein